MADQEASETPPYEPVADNYLAVAYKAAKERAKEGDGDILALVAAGFVALTDAGWTFVPPAPNAPERSDG